MYKFEIIRIIFLIFIQRPLRVCYSGVFHTYSHLFTHIHTYSQEFTETRANNREKKIITVNKCELILNHFLNKNTCLFCILNVYFNRKLKYQFKFNQINAKKALKSIINQAFSLNLIQNVNDSTNLRF